MAAVQSSMHFLVRDKLYNDEKPFQLKFIPEDEVPMSNYRLEKRDGINITSMRGHESRLSFEKNGFTVVKMNQETPYTDFENPEGIRAYLRTVVQSVQALLGADKVQVFSYAVRRRDPEFPLKAGGEGQDTSLENAASTSQQVLRDPTLLSNCQRYQIVNVWKPLRGPLRDWPLALCDATTVSTADLIATDNVYPNREIESLLVHYADTQAWYYLPDQQASELLIFRQADSASADRLGVPHSSFANPLAGPDELPRESIEVRTLVSYGVSEERSDPVV